MAITNNVNKQVPTGNLVRRWKLKSRPLQLNVSKSLKFQFRRRGPRHRVALNVSTSEY